MNKISILIPVYNEKDSLLEVIKRVEAVDFGLEKEIILVDDYSTDGTRELYPKINHKVILHEKNMGKGAAVRTALKEAEGDIIIIQDADLEYNPQDYTEIVNLIKNDVYDVVYGSRFLGNKNSGNFLLLSFLANITLSCLTRLLYKVEITDMETCYKAFRAEFIKDIKIESNRFDFEPEITAKVLRKNPRFSEMSISYNARGVNEGKKVNWKDGLQAIWTLFKYRFFD